MSRDLLHLDYYYVDDDQNILIKQLFSCYHFVCDEAVFHLVYALNDLQYELIAIQNCFAETDHDQFSDQTY